MDTPITEELLAQIEAELGQDGVWVAPQLRATVPAEVEEQIEQAVAQAPTPTYVVLARLNYRDQLTGGSFDDLAGIIRDDTGRTGVYIGPESGDEAELRIASFPDDYGLYQAARIARIEHEGDLGAQALRVVELLGSGQDLEALLEQAAEEHPEAADRLDESYGTPGLYGDDGAAWLPWTGGALVGVLVLAAVVRVLLRRRRATTAASPGVQGRSFVLPPAVLSTVRAAEDHRNEKRAQEEVLALGEAIDATEIDPRKARGLPAWQEALDHYDVARRILDREHSPADVVGASVLARRGREALSAARRGRAWSPTRPCYFNPLHPAAAKQARWRDGEASVTVPACGPCAEAVAAGREPDDVLDFVADGLPAHYFRLDLGVWSETGYGALDADLLGRLFRR